MRPCREPPGLEGLGDGFEKSKWSSVRLVRSGREMTHHLTQKEDRGGGRPQRCVRLASNVEESCGSCVNRLDPAGYELGVEVDMGGSLCAAREQKSVSCAGRAVCVHRARSRSGLGKLAEATIAGGAFRWRGGPLWASSYARGFLALSQGVVKTHAHGCPARKLQPARPRMSSRKTSEHSG